MNVYKPGLNMIDGIEFENGVWYYVEEEFKSESSLNAADGIYRLWLSKSGEEQTTPLIEVQKQTFWGNFQHWSDSFGYWFIDDFKISDSRIGPTSGFGASLAPPSSTNLTVN